MTPLALIIGRLHLRTEVFMFRSLILALLLAAAPGLAHAQSAPSFLTYGYTPSAGDWQGAFRAKQDVLNFTPLSLSGGTMRGKLTTQPATVNGAGFSILSGLAPTGPINGDFWIVGSTLYVQLGGSTTTFATSTSLSSETTRATSAEQANATAISAETTRAQAAEALKAPLASPAFAGTPTAPTATAGTASTQIASTGFVAASFLPTATAAATYAPLASPAFTGTPTAPTPAANDNSTRIATTAALQTAIANVAANPMRSFRNRIINGNFAVNQRGTATASTAYAAGGYTYDRWKAGASGATVSFASGANGDTTASVTAGSLLQVIEGAVYLPEGGTYIASWSGTATCRAYQGTATGTYVASPLAISGWTSGTNATLECQSGSLTGVQLEPGTQATTFERRDDELRRCQRYYQTDTAQIIGSTAAANYYVGIWVALKTTMKAVPTVVGTDIAGSRVSSNGLQGTDSQTTGGFRAYTTSNAPAGQVAAAFSYTASSEL